MGSAAAAVATELRRNKLSSRINYDIVNILAQTLDEDVDQFRAPGPIGLAGGAAQVGFSGCAAAADGRAPPARRTVATSPSEPPRKAAPGGARRRARCVSSLMSPTWSMCVGGVCARRVRIWDLQYMGGASWSWPAAGAQPMPFDRQRNSPSMEQSHEPRRTSGRAEGAEKQRKSRPTQHHFSRGAPKYRPLTPSTGS